MAPQTGWRFNAVLISHLSRGFRKLYLALGAHLPPKLILGFFSDNQPVLKNLGDLAFPVAEVCPDVNDISLAGDILDQSSIAAGGQNNACQLELAQIDHFQRRLRNPFRGLAFFGLNLGGFLGFEQRNKRVGFPFGIIGVRLVESQKIRQVWRRLQCFGRGYDLFPWFLCLRQRR